MRRRFPLKGDAAAPFILGGCVHNVTIVTSTWALMLKAFFRHTPELLLCLALAVLVIHMIGYVGGTWAIATHGYQLENFDVSTRLVASFAAALIQPAILFGLAAITAALRDRTDA